MPLSNLDIPAEITKDMNILVHCAQGHGRSATYTAKLIYELGIFPDRYDLLGLIMKCRPNARPSKEQLNQILNYAKSLRNSRS